MSRKVSLQRRLRLLRSKSGGVMCGVLCGKLLHTISKYVTPFGTQLSSYWPKTPKDQVDHSRT